MAGSSITKTSDTMIHAGSHQPIKYRKIVIDFVGDDTTGAVPNLTIVGISGFIVQAVTNPGSTGPTDNYDIALNHAEGGDVLGGGLANRDIANSEIVNFDPKIFVESEISYTLTVSNTSVNDATGKIVLYIQQDL